MSARRAVTFAVWSLVIGGSAEAQGSRADHHAVRAQVNRQAAALCCVDGAYRAPRMGPLWRLTASASRTG